MQVRGIDAHYVLSKDFARAIAFYRALLGCDPTTRFATGAEFDLSDGSTLGIGYIEGTYYPGGGALFAVDDVGASLELVRENGGTVLAGPMNTPNCVIAWCIDSEGNTFALHKRGPARP